MKQLNNTCIEVLPALLDRTKTSTIRKAWKIIPKEKCVNTNKDILYEKPPKYKVGDIVEMVWDDDSKLLEYDWFYTDTGAGVHICSNEDYFKGKTIFAKILGKVKITEVFMVEIIKDTACLIDTERFYVSGINPLYLQAGTHAWSDTEVYELAKADGFKSAEEMFKYFDKLYSLDTTKKFYVYRWVWI